MDWVHCNGCCIQPGVDKSRKFHLTNCGHIFCSQCLEAGVKPKCKVCGTEPCNTILLATQMSPEVQQYFSDPMDLIRKAMQISSFQKGHRSRLSSYQSGRGAEHFALAEENKKLREKLVQMAKYTAQVEAKLAYYKKKLVMVSEMPVQTPTLSQVGRISPAITPTMYSPASTIGSQRTSIPGSAASAERRRTSPHFADLSMASNSMRRSSPAPLRNLHQGADISRQQNKSSPRERFLNYMPVSQSNQMGRK